jgi:hypothetical protein
LTFVLAALVVALVVAGVAVRNAGEKFGLSEAQIRTIQTSCERRADQRHLLGERRTLNIASCVSLERTVRAPDLPPN